MKKIFALLLVALLCVSLLAGCGKSEEEKAKDALESALKDEMGDEAWNALQSEMKAGADLDKEIAEKDKANEDKTAQREALNAAYDDAYNALYSADYASISSDEMQMLIDNYQKAHYEFGCFVLGSDEYDDTLYNDSVFYNCKTQITDAEEKILLAAQKLAAIPENHRFLINNDTRDFIFIVDTADADNGQAEYSKGYVVTPEYDRIDYDFTDYKNMLTIIAVGPNTLEFTNIDSDWVTYQIDFTSGSPVFCEELIYSDSRPYSSYESYEINTMIRDFVNDN